MGSEFVWEFAKQLVSHLWWFGVVVAVSLITAAAIATRSRHRRKSEGPAADAIARADWREFERLTADALRGVGYEVMENAGSHAHADGGVDLVAHRDGKTYLVQCKHVRAPVNVGVVRELFGEMAARRADGCIVASSNSFSTPARKWASDKQVELLDGADLASLLDGVSSKDETVQTLQGEKARARSCPECGAEMVPRLPKKEAAFAGLEFWGCSRFAACYAKLEA